MSAILVLFAKPPLPGVSKTRLAADLGEERAARIAAALLADTISLAEGTKLEDAETVPRLVCAYAGEGEWFATRLGTRWELLQQHGDALDERLDWALADIAPGREDATIFIGMDSPHLAPGILPQAFTALERSRTVLGPCDDGGYYLVGVTGRWPAGILAGVRWSTQYALSDTTRAFAEAGLHPAMLPMCYDIDGIEDLRRLAGDVEDWQPDRLPHVREALSGISLS
jgi:rSAM/selenodomain-associated transferase 1